jgi:general secretion pathway protein J
MKHSRGFTLIEMVAAIAIFAVIATISYASLNRFLDSTTLLESELRDIRQLQKAFSVISRDMRYASARVVRDEYGDPEPVLVVNNPLVAGELLRLTTQQRNLDLPGTSTVQRTAYRLEGDSLVRIRWKVLDRDQEDSEIRYPLISGVENVTVNVIRIGSGTTEPLDELGLDQQLPDGIEWHITMNNGRQYTRLFEVKHEPAG